MLAQRRHVDVAEHGGVERIATAVRIRRRMRRLAPVADRHLVDCDHVHRQQVGVGGVDHEGGVDAGEGACVDQPQLAAAALLRGRSDHGHPAAELVGQCSRRQPRPQPGGGDDVVAAGVPDGGQRVVLAQDGDRRTGGAGMGLERGVDAPRGAGDAEALILEYLSQQVVGEAFLVAQLGPGVDLVGQVDQDVAAPVDLGGQAGLGVGQVGGGAVHPVTLVGCRRGNRVRSTGLEAMRSGGRSQILESSQAVPIASGDGGRSCRAAPPGGAARAPLDSPPGRTRRRP